MDEADLDDLLDDAFEDAAADEDEAMYEDDDEVDLDALLDDAADDVFTSVPASAPAAPVARPAAAPPSTPAATPAPNSSTRSSIGGGKVVGSRGGGGGSKVLKGTAGGDLGRLLLEAGLPAEAAGRWCQTMRVDAAAQQGLAGRQRPLSRAYRAWNDRRPPPSQSQAASGGKTGASNQGAAAEEGEEEGGGGEGFDTSGHVRATKLFGDVLQRATTRAKLKPAASNSVVAALHGKHANADLVAAVQRLYLEEVSRALKHLPQAPCPWFCPGSFSVLHVEGPL